MIDLERRRHLGDTAAEYLKDLPLFLDSDGEGLWAIVPAARSFGFAGADLLEFVRLSLLRLLDAGGIPVRHAGDGELLWRAQTHYGSTHREIADGVVREWLAAGAEDPEWGWLWFVNESVLKASRRWQADRRAPSEPADVTKFVLQFYNSTTAEESELNVWGKPLYLKVKTYLEELCARGKCASPKPDYYILDENELQRLYLQFHVERR